MTEIDYKVKLATQVENQVMACIGCNDCMLACPLPQTRNVTIGELNFAVHQETITNQRVIDFVTACTQCRQCVPVCPADLSRADMVLFNKIRVENTVPDQEIMLQVGEHVTPSSWTLDGLAAHLLQLPLFEGVSKSDLRRLLLKITLRQLSAGEVLCREGEFHERLYVILDGAVEQTVAATLTGEAEQILVLGAGSFHGELAVLADQAEQFTVTALQPSTVIEIPKAPLYQFMEQSEPFRERMDALYNRRAMWTYARSSPVLEALPEDALRAMLQEAEILSLKAGDTLVKEGDKPEAMYLVRSGFLRVARQIGDYGERVLLYFREGDTFGTFPLLVGESGSAYSVTANTTSDVIRVPAKALLGVLDSRPELRSKLVAEAMEAEKVVRSTDLGPPLEVTGQGQRANTTQLNLSWSNLLDEGVLQSHELLVIDQAICVDCNNCVDACGRRHGHTRLQRRGLQLDNLLFPTACRHCEDPVCLLCSVNGIVRLPDGEITIVTDNCIGCGACASRCPYGNINMHSLEPQKENFLQRLLSFTRSGGEMDMEFKALHSHEPKVAVKCDLCAGYEDYACVTACPVGAAFRIDPVEAFQRENLHIGMEMRSKEAGHGPA
jgi:CRP-like cAMP-binding protein/Fe-S-cluster-containing hydrogenase component 2